MTALWVRGLAAARPLGRLAAALLLASLASRALAAEPIVVLLDQARVLKLPERAATVVIGDPLIADLSIQPGGLAVVTAKGYGATNVIVLDQAGAVLMEKFLEVRGPIDPIVVVYRGVTRETYSCTPDCSPRITLGDDSVYFDKTVNQTTTRNNAAAAVAAGTQR